MSREPQETARDNARCPSTYAEADRRRAEAWADFRAAFFDTFGGLFVPVVKALARINAPIEAAFNRLLDRLVGGPRR
jgi:hypothetical protein